MIKIIGEGKKDNMVIPMSQMMPMQVGIIVDDIFKGNYVLRTQNSAQFEIINLSMPTVDNCWDSKSCNIKVRLLGPGESITVKLSND